MTDSFIVFDWILFVITGVLSIVFLMGRGERIIRSFDSKSDRVRRKMSPEDKAKFLRACGYFCLVLCATSVLLIFFHQVRAVPFIAVGVAVLDIIFFARYTNKNLPPDTKF